MEAKIRVNIDVPGEELGILLKFVVQGQACVIATLITVGLAKEINIPHSNVGLGLVSAILLSSARQWLQNCH